MRSPGLLVVLASLCVLTRVHGEEDGAHELMLRYPLIDGHNDFAFQLRKLHSNRLSQIDLHNVTTLATDISRLHAGHVQAQLFAVYVMCGAQEKDAVRLTLEQIDVVRRMCTEYEEFELVTSVQELKNSKSRQKIACLISIEGGHSIDSSLPTLRMFYQLGVRSMSLTHNCNTPWAESSSKLYDIHQRQNNSLTDFGKAVVEEMNRLGMIVDLSHTSWETASAALEHSKAPVIFSHSSSHFLCRHHRNVPDWLLHKLKKNRGLIMVNLYSNFITCRDEADISNVVDHFDHIKNLIGAESIGIGGDFEGVERVKITNLGQIHVLGYCSYRVAHYGYLHISGPALYVALEALHWFTKIKAGLEDVSKYPTLIQALLQRGWTENELADVLRRNFLRVFEEVERVRDQLSSKPPSEVQIPTELVQNPCRMVLKPPNSLRLSFDLRPYSRAHHGPKALLMLDVGLLLSSLLMIL